MRHWILFLFIQLPVSLLAQSTDSSATTAAVPGSTGRVVIRCLSLAVEEPIYVVDGVIWQPADVRQLNLNRIKSISILKDPSAGAIFCRSARGGVIVIELTPATCVLRRTIICGTASISDSLERPAGGFLAYPNPVRRGTSINLTIPEGKDGHWQLQLFSISGQLVQTRQLIQAGKSNQHQVPITAATPAGSYLLQLQGPAGERITEKVIIQ